MARDGPPKIMKMGWLLEESVIMGLQPTKSDEIRRTVGQAIEPAAAFQAAGVCVSATRQDGLAGRVFDRADAFQAAAVWANRAPAESRRQARLHAPRATSSRMCCSLSALQPNRKWLFSRESMSYQRNGVLTVFNWLHASASQACPTKTIRTSITLVLVGPVITKSCNCSK